MHQKRKPQRQQTPQRSKTTSLSQRKLTTPSRPADHLLLQRAVARPGHMTPGDMQVVQRSYGNRAALRLMAKMSANALGDRYEQEADRVAKQAVDRLGRPSAIGGQTTLQRQERPEEQAQTQSPQRQEKEELQVQPIQHLPGERGMAAAPGLETAIRRERGEGKSLPDNVRGPMERAFGTDFGGVRVHANAGSERLNRAIAARAFTTGQDIFFRQDEYNPGSTAGKELLAHELTHVVQQAGGSESGFKERKVRVGQVGSAIQRKTQNIHIDKRFTKWRYTKRVKSALDSIVAKIKAYNAIQMEDTNYADHIQQLETIKAEARSLQNTIGRWKFLAKKGTWRSLGGPFRYRYYMLTRNLVKLAGASSLSGLSTEQMERLENYKGAVENEIAAVKEQNLTLIT